MLSYRVLYLASVAGYNSERSKQQWGLQVPYSTGLSTHTRPNVERWKSK